jgi:hypothetical protein
MGWISDSNAKEIAAKSFPAEEYEDFLYHLTRMRHLHECVVTNTPSEHCKFTDLAENLSWCRVGIKIHEAPFEHYMQRVIMHREAEKGTRQ